MLEEQILKQLKDQHADIRKMSQNIDLLSRKLLEHDVKLNNLVERDEFADFKNEVLKGQDKIITSIKRFDEERISAVALLKIFEDSLEIQRQKIQEHDDTIQQAKAELNIT